MNFHLILQNKHLTRNKEKWNYTVKRTKKCKYAKKVYNVGN